MLVAPACRAQLIIVIVELVHAGWMACTARPRSVTAPQQSTNSTAADDGTYCTRRHGPPDPHPNKFMKREDGIQTQPNEVFGELELRALAHPHESTDGAMQHNTSSYRRRYDVTQRIVDAMGQLSRQEAGQHRGSRKRLRRSSLVRTRTAQSSHVATHA